LRLLRDNSIWFIHVITSSFITHIPRSYNTEENCGKSRGSSS
jgi:hypothetical protein